MDHGVIFCLHVCRTVILIVFIACACIMQRNQTLWFLIYWTIHHVQCQAKKLHCFTFARTLSDLLYWNNYWHTYVAINLEQSDLKVFSLSWRVLWCKMRHTYMSQPASHSVMQILSPRSNKLLVYCIHVSNSVLAHMLIALCRISFHLFRVVKVLRMISVDGSCIV